MTYLGMGKRLQPLQALIGELYSSRLKDQRRTHYPHQSVDLREMFRVIQRQGTSYKYYNLNGESANDWVHEYGTERFCVQERSEFDTNYKTLSSTVSSGYMLMFYK